MTNALIARCTLTLLIPTLAFSGKVPNAQLFTSDPPSICDAIGANLLQNCGFEHSDFSGWTQSGNTNSTFVVGNFDGFQPNGGALFAALGPSGTDGFLSQTIATTPGAFYTLAWYLTSDGNTPNEFNVTWGGNTIFSQTDLAVPDFVLYSFSEIATSVSTTLTFGFRNELGYLALDDTSVTAQTPVTTTPEPDCFGLLVVGAAGLPLCSWVRRHRCLES